MKFYINIILSLLVLSMFSCEDRLEIDPAQSITGDKATQTADNIQNILIGAYDEAGQTPGYGGRIQLLSDLLGSSTETVWTGTFIQPREVKNKKILPTNSFIQGLWDNSYEVINQVNLVLDNIDIVTDAGTKATIEGEAKFLRGLAYFDLLRLYGSGSNGVPLRTSAISDYAVDLAIARDGLSAGYDLVVNDLKAAYELLPADNSFFADKYAAQALLARVYLQLGNYGAARDAANDVIENSGHSLSADFASAFNHDSDGAEDIFAFQVTSQTGSNNLITHYADEGNGGRQGDVIVTDDYIAIFDDAANDQRASFFYTSGQSGERLTSKYTNQFGNVILIRLAEMYLIRAEANLKMGSTVGASPLDDVNTVRARSGASALSDVTDMLIWQERQRELAFEGFAIHDAKRTQSNVGDLSYDNPALTMPIPQAEMDTNPSMTQNPGYN